LALLFTFEKGEKMAVNSSEILDSGHDGCGKWVGHGEIRARQKDLRAEQAIERMEKRKARIEQQRGGKTVVRDYL
jgi:hypothetical protein